MILRILSISLLSASIACAAATTLPTSDEGKEDKSSTIPVTTAPPHGVGSSRDPVTGVAPGSPLDPHGKRQDEVRRVLFKQCPEMPTSIIDMIANDEFFEIPEKGIERFFEKAYTPPHWDGRNQGFSLTMWDTFLHIVSGEEVRIPLHTGNLHQIFDAARLRFIERLTIHIPLLKTEGAKIIAAFIRTPGQPTEKPLHILFSEIITPEALHIIFDAIGARPIPLGSLAFDPTSWYLGLVGVRRSPNPHGASVGVLTTFLRTTKSSHTLWRSLSMSDYNLSLPLQDSEDIIRALGDRTAKTGRYDTAYKDPKKTLLDDLCRSINAERVIIGLGPIDVKVGDRFL